MLELIHELYQFGWANELVRLTFELIHAWYQVGWEWIVLIHFCVDTIVYQFGWAVNSINSSLCGYNSCINLVAWVWVMGVSGEFKGHRASGSTCLCVNVKQDAWLDSPEGVRESIRIPGSAVLSVCVIYRVPGSVFLRVCVCKSGYLARQSWVSVVRVSGYLARQSWGYVIDLDRISGSIFLCECVYWVNQERVLLLWCSVTT